MDHEQHHQENNQSEYVIIPNRGRRNALKKTKRAFIFIIAVAVIITVAFLASRFNKLGGEKMISSIARDAYYAVFLTNEQVYFGRITAKTADELTLFDVFYLQTASGGVAGLESEPRFNLVKLGDELHGPKDELVINLDHVIFYEEMRPDSRIVEAINKYER